MRPVRSLLIYIVVIFVGGALLAPWLHALVQQLGGQFPSFEKLARSPFHRYVNRSLLVLAVLGLWPLLRSLNLRRLSDIGLACPATPSQSQARFRVNWKHLGVGFALGFISLAIIAALTIGLGVRDFCAPATTAKLVKHLFNATSAAILVAVLEEVLFRGAIFGAFRKFHSWIVALLLSSAIYAIVHFFAKPAPAETIHWASGFVTLGQMLRGFTDFQTLVPGFFNLLLAGTILALAFQFTGTLYLSIGLHAGWIFWLKSYGFISRDVPGTNVWFWGTAKLIDGWAALIVLSTICALLIVWRKRLVTTSKSCAG